jgi:hypothetical protein
MYIILKKGGKKRPSFFPKVFWDSQIWTKKMSKNENLKIVLGNFAPSLHKKKLASGD